MKELKCTRATSFLITCKSDALPPSPADPAVKDSSDYTPLDYATENGLLYCGLLLSKPQQSMESDQDNRRCMHRYSHLSILLLLNKNTLYLQLPLVYDIRHIICDSRSRSISAAGMHVLQSDASYVNKSC